MNLAVAPEGDALLMRKLPGSDLTHPAWGKAPGLYRYGLKDAVGSEWLTRAVCRWKGQMAECITPSARGVALMADPLPLSQ